MARQTVPNSGLWSSIASLLNSNFIELYDNGPTRQVVVNSLSDFPAPVAGVITLAADTDYLLGDNVNLGTNRIVWASNATISGVSSIVNTLTYTGTDDMFTITNVRAQLKDITISCTSGRVFNFSDNTDSIFRVMNCTVFCDRFGTFTSSGSGGTTARFTNVSPGIVTTSGLSFSGNWNTWLWERSTINISAGAMFNLGTAVFNYFLTDTILVNLGATATFLSGLASSGNISATGSGQVRVTMSTGSGTILSGITPGDARWDFFHNSNIQDSRADGIVAMQGNATATTIITPGTYVKTAGTWTVISSSQFTGDTTGRLTYNGVKNVRVPILVSLSVEPVSGTNKTIGIRIAKNGTTIVNSTRTARTDSGTPVNISVPWLDTLSTNDFIEVFITNLSDTVNILASNATLRVN